jgi:hypothetical protein
VRPNRRRSRMTACRSDRHAFETPYVVNSGVHLCTRRWSNPSAQWARWSVSRQAHWTTASYGRARVPCSGIVGRRRSYSIALRSTCTGLLFIRSCDESNVEW